MNYLEDDTMSEFLCQICVNPFNQTENLPKILPCGHTLCKACVANITTVSNKLCPICKRSIGSSDPATNYSLLKLCDAITDTPATLRDDVTKIYISRISKNLLDVQLHVSNAIKDATSLRAFGYENEVFQQELEDARITFNDVQISMSSLKEKLFQSQDAPVVNINIKTVKLTEIAERIYKGEKIFAVAFINDEKKYGKIFQRRNFLILSALSNTEIPKGSSLFWLCDLLRYHHLNIYPYVAVYDDSSQQTTRYVFSDVVGNCDYKTLDVFTGESDKLLKDCMCFWKDKSTLVIKMDKSKNLNIKVQERKFIRHRLESGLSIPAEISITNHQRNPILDAGAVGRFFTDNNLSFLFPKDDGIKTVKEHGIVLMTTPNKVQQ